MTWIAGVLQIIVFLLKVAQLFSEFTPKARDHKPSTETANEKKSTIFSL